MSQKQAQLLNPINGNINISGIVTATSFVGSGEGLTGVASTDNIQTATEATFLSGVKITGVTTASGGVIGNVTGNATGLSGTPSIVVGSVTGTTGTFTGNVSVGGTLTYQDATNMDVLGIGTFQQGIQILANGANVTGIVTVGLTTIKSGEIEVVGVITATSFQGDGSQLSGVESGVVNFVASGTISNGSTVVINTDGTVGIVTQTTVLGPTVGTEVVFNSGSTQHISSTYDSTNGKVVIAYADAGNSDYGTAIVGTVSGTSISFGSEVVYNSAASYYNSCAYDSTNSKVVISYRDDGNSYDGTAIVGTVSGTSISFGSEAVFSTTSEYATTTFVGSGKVVIAYRGSSNYGKAIVGTVSGTSISFGSEATFNSAETNAFSSTFDSTNGKVVIAYSDAGNSSYGTAIVGTVSGTSISFGSEVVYSGATSDRRFSLTFDSTNGKVVIAYRDQNNSNYGSARVGTVSGTSISFGTAVVFESAATNHISATYDSNSGKVVIAYYDVGNSSYGTVVTGTVSGTSISFGTPVVYDSGGTITYISATYDSTNKKVVVAYKDGGNSNYGTSIVIDSSDTITTNLTAENYIGIAAEAISNTATGKINVVTGTNSGQTGLTIAQKYFVQPTGILSTSAGSPSVVAGTAISDTKILVR
jgi:hypothetical protein